MEPAAYKSRRLTIKAVEFVVRTPMNKPDVVEVRYDCDCGCKPRARYQRGSSEAGHDQCCCGRVHFVGMDAEDRLEAYLQEQDVSGEGAGVHYTVSTEEVAAPWGEPVAVAWGVPDKLHKH